MKDRSIAILVISMLVLTMMAVMLVVFIDKAHDDFHDSITVTKEGVTEKTLTVSDLMLNPTEKRTYEVSMTCPASGTFDVTLDYTETVNGGLKHFVNVEIYGNEELIYDGNLLELLDTDKIVEFQTELHATNPTVIKFVYEMPYETGNEAQSTYADFDIDVTITKY